MGTPPPVLTANIGMSDTILLMILALVVFGPRRLPQIGRQIGKLMFEFRKASNDFKFQMEEELRQSEEAERRKKDEEARQRALAAAPPEAPKPELPSPEAQPLYESPENTTSAAIPEPAPESAQPVRPVDISRLDPDEYEPASAVPRILPPSTGERVAAGHPTAPMEKTETATNETGEAPSSVTPETERSEPAAHHG